MLVYHFTAFLHLPDILEHGLSKGEVPAHATMRADKIPQAVNLTRIPERERQAGWGAFNAALDKTKIRITIDVDREDVLSFKEVRKKYKISPKWAKALGSGADPFNHFFFHGTIEPDKFRTVEVWDDEGYKPLGEADLDELVAKIEKEKENIELTEVNGAKFIKLKDGVAKSWLLDGRREL